MADAATLDAIGGGAHACLTFTDAEERLDLVAGFVRDGLRRREKVICWSDELAPDALIKELAARSVRPGAALRRGQLSVAAAGDSPLVRDSLGAGTMVGLLSAEVERAEAEGYGGLRVTLDMCCATRPTAAADQLVGFESSVAPLFADGRLCMICQYDRDRFDAVTLAFAAQAHPVTIAAQVYFESPLLRICRQYSPAGLRVAGEIDYRHADVLEQALAEVVRLDRRPYAHLDGLSYIDAACAAVFIRAAGRLPTTRTMTVSCGRLVATMLDLVGAAEVTQLRVRRSDGRPSYDQS
ncbi:MAG TPA: MEDS domain-containing protein [Micromonosporaceae bacterium]|jgi:anti-anti-sigma regulatory factor